MGTVKLDVGHRGGFVDQIIERVRAEITQERWPVEYKLSSVAQLATELGRSVVKALAHRTAACSRRIKSLASSSPRSGAATTMISHSGYVASQSRTCMRLGEHVRLKQLAWPLADDLVALENAGVACSRPRWASSPEHDMS